ncbi:hypothetical protein MMC30_007754 [Trapelia coarctata]|nr:hypothetical protein [Trapelia coarctata]
MLIGLMSLKNGIVYIQFHPLVYIVKLNIEMSMAALVTKIAISGERTDFQQPHTISHNYDSATFGKRDGHKNAHSSPAHHLRNFSNYATGVTIGNGHERTEAIRGIEVKSDVVVDTVSLEDGYEGRSKQGSEDDVPLRTVSFSPTVQRGLREPWEANTAHEREGV